MSITHDHICAVINTYIIEGKLGKTIRILDMGCGNGRMICFLHRKLGELHPDRQLEIFGYDVDDSRVQEPEYFAETLKTLQEKAPTVDWLNRLHRVRSTDFWPYPDNYFDFVVSNQVMEHVMDHTHAFTEICRVLNSTGVSIHLFPLVHYIYEGHLNLPFVHWLKNEDLLYNYIKTCSRIFLGKYKLHKKINPLLSVEEFSRRHTDYIIYETNYLTLNETFKITKHSKLRCHYRYTKHFYVNKLRQVFRIPLKYTYQIAKYQLIERFIFSILMRASCVTLIVEKNNRYTTSI
jgi:ubiquinone/menaquinone biosynthesis C-methylase UbiE